MKRIVLFSAAALVAFAASAQETYENAKLLGEDLNGTARYVGMGGAMDALGADLSTISSNPAGIGLFRHSTANVSFGVVSQQDGKSFADGDKTNMSFDQVGFVYARRVGRKSFINLAFNYHKSKNFDYILSAAGRLNGTSSQNKQTYLKSQTGKFNLRGNSTLTGDANAFTQTDYLYSNVLLPNGEDEQGGYVDGYYGADGYQFDRAHTGYIGTYDFNISGNINDRVYLGLTFGIHDVHYNGYSEYTEGILDASDASIGSVTMQDDRKITGTGFDIKAGIIVRPIEDNPMRFGLSIATPTWYDLTTENYTKLYNNLSNNYGYYDDGRSDEVYDFKLYTPWKFGVSFGTTISNWMAIGAQYEYADYSSADTRIEDNGYYDWYYDEYYSSSSSDKNMNRHTENTLKGVSTLRLGVEMKPVENLAVRFGYNYVSPMYEKDGVKTGSVDSPGSYYSSTTDYTNWKSINRVTCGVGYNVEKFSFDLAYQYSAQNGDFYAFDNKSYSENVCNKQKVKNNRHQVLLTLGYHF